MKKNHLSGFTLVEMVVATAVVLALAVIMMSATRSFREQGDRVGCVTGLRQIYVALQSYMNDHEQRIVPHKTVTAQSWFGWYSKLSAYMGDRKPPLPMVPRCPGFRPSFTPTVGYSGYALNANCDNRKFTTIESPGTTPILWDDKQLGSNNYGGWPNPTHGTGGTYCDIDFRHGTQANVLMLDGSVIPLAKPGSPAYAVKASPKDFPQYHWRP